MHPRITYRLVSYRNIWIPLGQQQRRVLHALLDIYPYAIETKKLSIKLGIPIRQLNQLFTNLQSLDKTWGHTIIDRSVRGFVRITISKTDVTFYET